MNSNNANVLNKQILNTKKDEDMTTRGYKVSGQQFFLKNKCECKFKTCKQTRGQMTG